MTSHIRGNLEFYTEEKQIGTDRHGKPIMKTFEYVRTSPAARKAHEEKMQAMGMEKVFVDLPQGRRGYSWKKRS